MSIFNQFIAKKEKGTRTQTLDCSIRDMKSLAYQTNCSLITTAGHFNLKFHPYKDTEHTFEGELNHERLQKLQATKAEKSTFIS